jgi:hypothetical protein
MPIFQVQPEWLLGNTPQVKNGKVGNGVQGNLDTVHIMREIARARSKHPLVRELALKILQFAQVPSQNYYDEAKAIGDYVRRKVRYVRDIQGVETLIDPITLIDQLRRGEAQGDCDDMSLLIASLLLSIGHSPYFRIVKYRNEARGFSHIYVVDYDRNHGEQRKRRISLDAIMKRQPIGYEVPHASGREIKV